MAGSQQRSSVSPYLIVRDATAAIDFYQRALGAEEAYRLTDPQGRIGHAELRFGGSLVMLADEHPEFGALSPASVGGTPVRLHLAVDDADRTVGAALAAGATLLRPVQDQFHGERSGMIADPFGHLWHIGAATEAVTPEEMQRRWTAALSESPA
jgi:PhnB protein